VGLTLEAEFVSSAERYYDLLRVWNRRINLTALRLDDFPTATIDRLLIEPLQAAEFIPEESGLDCLDVGSGGGSPAIPINIARPLVRLTMVEAVAKKAAFLREAVRILGLSGATVLTARIEEAASLRSGTADIVLIRGVRLDSQMSSILDRLLKPGGRLFRFGAPTVLPPNWREAGRKSLASGGELVIAENLRQGLG
jgi:16S rRNA (guanine527-N7)-methyltransferase